MRNATGTNVAAPKWSWVALGVGVLMLFGSIWWAISTGPSPKDRASAEPYEPVGAGPVPVREYPTAVLPPTQTRAPWTAGECSRPRITVAPVQSLPAPRPVVIPLAQPIPKRAHAAQNRSPVADMFPFGPIAPRETERERDDPPQTEQFPSFIYSGVSWKFTGAYADAGQVVLSPTGLELGGRSVLTLADVPVSEDVLFVQSRFQPEKFAIYR